MIERNSMKALLAAAVLTLLAVAAPAAESSTKTSSPAEQKLASGNAGTSATMVAQTGSLSSGKPPGANPAPTGQRPGNSKSKKDVVNPPQADCVP